MDINFLISISSVLLHSDITLCGLRGTEECKFQVIRKKRTCLTNGFYKAYVSHNQDFEQDHTLGIKFREKNNLIALMRLRSGACSMFANSVIFLIKNNFMLPKLLWSND